VKIRDYLFFATSLLLFSMTTNAWAEIALPTGWYFEFNLGRSSVIGAKYVSGGSTSGSGLGWNLDAGYRFMPYLAAELGFTKYTDATGMLGGVKVASGSQYSYDIIAKGILPINSSGFEIFAKIGAARIHSTISQTGVVTVNSGTRTRTGLIVGIGADYAIYPALTTNVQWTRAKGNDATGKMDLLSIGLSYNFG